MTSEIFQSMIGADIDAQNATLDKAARLEQKKQEKLDRLNPGEMWENNQLDSMGTGSTTLDGTTYTNHNKIFNEDTAAQRQGRLSDFNNQGYRYDADTKKYYSNVDNSVITGKIGGLYHGSDIAGQDKEKFGYYTLDADSGLSPQEQLEANYDKYRKSFNGEELRSGYEPTRDNTSILLSDTHSAKGMEAYLHGNKDNLAGRTYNLMDTKNLEDGAGRSYTEIVNSGSALGDTSQMQTGDELGAMTLRDMQKIAINKDTWLQRQLTKEAARDNVIATLDKQDGYVGELVDQAQSQGLKLYADVSNMLRKGTRELARSVGISEENVDKYLPINAELIGTDTPVQEIRENQQLRDSMVGYSSDSRKEWSDAQAEIMENAENKEYGTMAWNILTHLPQYLADSAPEMAAIMLPGGMPVVVGTRLSNQMEEFEENNGRGMTLGEAVEAGLAITTTLYAEKVLIKSGVAGAVNKGTSKLGKTGAIVGTAAGEAAQELGEKVQEDIYTGNVARRRDIAEWIDSATDAEAVVSMAAGGAMGGVLRGAGEAVQPTAELVSNTIRTAKEKALGEADVRVGVPRTKEARYEAASRVDEPGFEPEDDEERAGYVNTVIQSAIDVSIGAEVKDVQKGRASKEGKVPIEIAIDRVAKLYKLDVDNNPALREVVADMVHEKAYLSDDMKAFRSNLEGEGMLEALKSVFSGPKASEFLVGKQVDNIQAAYDEAVGSMATELGVDPDIVKDEYKLDNASMEKLNAVINDMHKLGSELGSTELVEEAEKIRELITKRQEILGSEGNGPTTEDGQYQRRYKTKDSDQVAAEIAELGLQLKSEFKKPVSKHKEDVGKYVAVMESYLEGSQIDPTDVDLKLGDTLDKLQVFAQSRATKPVVGTGNGIKNKAKSMQIVSFMKSVHKDTKLIYTGAARELEQFADRLTDEQKQKLPEGHLEAIEDTIAQLKDTILVSNEIAKMSPDMVDRYKNAEDPILAYQYVLKMAKQKHAASKVSTEQKEEVASETEQEVEVQQPTTEEVATETVDEETTTEAEPEIVEEVVTAPEDEQVKPKPHTRLKNEGKSVKGLSEEFDYVAEALASGQFIASRPKLEVDGNKLSKTAFVNHMVDEGLIATQQTDDILDASGARDATTKTKKKTLLREYFEQEVDTANDGKPQIESDELRDAKRFMTQLARDPNSKGYSAGKFKDNAEQFDSDRQAYRDVMTKLNPGVVYDTAYEIYQRNNPTLDLQEQTNNKSDNKAADKPNYDKLNDIINSSIKEMSGLERKMFTELVNKILKDANINKTDRVTKGFRKILIESCI